MLFLNLLFTFSFLLVHLWPSFSACFVQWCLYFCCNKLFIKESVSFYRFGSGGGQEVKNAICVLGLNMVNDKVTWNKVQRRLYHTSFYQTVTEIRRLPIIGDQLHFCRPYTTKCLWHIKFFPNPTERCLNNDELNFLDLKNKIQN